MFIEFFNPSCTDEASACTGHRVCGQVALRMGDTGRPRRGCPGTRRCRDDRLHPVRGDQPGGCQTFVPHQETSCFLGFTLPWLSSHASVVMFFHIFVTASFLFHLVSVVTRRLLCISPPSRSLRLSALFRSWVLCTGNRFVTTYRSERHFCVDSSPRPET